MTDSAQPSPVLFFETMNAYQRTAVLKGAIELDLFTAISEGAATAIELAKRCKASGRGIRILCDYLTVIGFLTKQGDRYGLTPDAAMFLDRRSPAYLGTATRFLASPTSYDAFRNVAETVRKGTTILAGEGMTEPEHPQWVEFARGMAPLMHVPAEGIAGILGAKDAAGASGKWKVLDIAAGHGMFGITLAKHNPKAEITALDWRNVLEVAKENAQAAGVAERYHTIAGSAFEAEMGTGYDVVLLTNILHHFDVATCESLLGRVHATLAPGGRAAILEFVPNDDRVSPPQAATFSMMMLGMTPAGDAYTFRELENMCRNAGFARAQLHPLDPHPEAVVVAIK
jgi:2-polyprenyl-3-methyl-5-hydroxy-6-metoxy-1,4-benzoquinol methylase